MKVAIVGGAAKKDCGVLSLGKSWEVWGLNLVAPAWFFQAYIGIDKMFHIHKRSDLIKEIPEHVFAFEEWAAKHEEVEFVLLEPWDAIPNATIFPHEELRKMPRGSYHCSSFDWMIAYALHLGATEIMLCGVQMYRDRGEPISSGPCIEYWCGYAEGRGVKVTVSKDSDLFYNYHLVRSNYVYGYDSWDLVEDRT